MTREASHLGGIATRDGFAAEFEQRTGTSWYAHISPGGKRRPRHSSKEKAARPRGGRVPKTRKEVTPTRFS